MNYKSGKINIYSALLRLVLLNAFVSLTARIYPSWLPLGKITGILIILVLLVIYYKNLSYKDILFLHVLFLFSILPVIKSTNMGNTVEHVLDYFTSMLILWKATCSNFRKRLLNEIYVSKQLINLDIQISMIILVISFLLQSNYFTSNGEKVFYGFALSNHILCGTVIFYMALILVYLNDKKLNLKYLIYYGILVISILLAGARTYLGATVVFLIALYSLKLRTYSLRHFIVPGGFLAIVYLFLNSSAYSRFIGTMSNQYISSNPIEAITSGRTIWWKIDIEQYMNFSLIERLFGAGHSIVYDINEKYYGLRIWAHNDFIQLLLATGIIGLAFYLVVFIKLFFSIKKDNVVRLIKFPILIVLGSFIINAIFNGYYGNLRMVMATVLLTLAVIKMEVKCEN